MSLKLYFKTDSTINCLFTDVEYNKLSENQTLEDLRQSQIISMSGDNLFKDSF